MSISRFTPKYVISNNGCWEWTAGQTSAGYGLFYDSGKMIYSHRWSYEYYVGEIPQSMHIDHLCRVRHCVNPKHLEVVSTQENTRRGDHSNMGWNQRIKTHCPSGHPYSEENTYYRANKERRCKTCAKEYSKRKYYEKVNK